MKTWLLTLALLASVTTMAGTGGKQVGGPGTRNAGRLAAKPEAASGLVQGRLDQRLDPVVDGLRLRQRIGVHKEAKAEKAREREEAKLLEGLAQRAAREKRARAATERAEFQRRAARRDFDRKRKIRALLF